MRIVKYLVVGATAAVAVGLTASPAMAAPTADTDVTFEVVAGTLDIVAPATTDLAPGVMAGPLGLVTVTDDRASADASWAATVVSTDFTTGTATDSETILAAEVEYSSGAATSSGTGTFTPGQATVGNEAPLDNATPLPAMTHAGGTGNNTASWTPNLTVNPQQDNQAGIYTGTVTHSVA